MRAAGLVAALLVAMMGVSSAQAASCASEDGGAPLNGECTTLPESFVQTILAMRMMKLNDDGSITFVDSGGGVSAYDFASVSAGAVLGDFVNAESLPDGTYVGVSPVIDPEATIRASVTVDGRPARS